jgi:lipopolysaccharide transport system permease protein
MRESSPSFPRPEPAAPPPAEPRVLRARRGYIAVDLPELWRYRELFLFLAWRDILVRYKQTALGIAWAILQPVLTTVVFVVIFGKLAKFPSLDAPYPVLIFAGLLPWQFFSNALSESSNSLVASARIITKVYFPRLIVPASAVLSGAVDALIALAILFGMMLYYGVPFTPNLLLLPAFLAFACLAALGAGTWLSALNVRYRDVRYIVPFFTRIGLYASPVGFISDVVPDSWRLWYSLNPMVGVIDGFRWCILGAQFEPHWPGFWLSAAVAALLLVTGVFYFRNTERTFADVI